MQNGFFSRKLIWLMVLFFDLTWLYIYAQYFTHAKKAKHSKSHSKLGIFAYRTHCTLLPDTKT